MPEPLDFERLAQRIALYFSPVPNGDALDPHAALRLIWNARGDADVALLRAGYFSVDAEHTIEHALRSLDR